MMAHFSKLQTPLRAVQDYPTTLAQENRFKNLGWSKASARNLWELWNDSAFISPEERISLDVLEPFDEWEEFALFGCHYFLLVADNSATSPGCETGEDPTLSSHTSTTWQGMTRSLEAEIRFSEYPKAQGYRRFAAALPLKGEKSVQDRVGNFAGMGLNTRINSYDVYGNEQSNDLLFNSHGTLVVPSSRMCHTITDIGDAGALLVGGRTSPDNALADCWIYHKWVDTWERVDDLPQPRYRHGAVNLGSGHVLISPGKKNSRDIDNDFYVWSRALGWTKCLQGPGEKPCPVYGATFTIFEKQPDLSGSRCGLLAGGMSADAALVGEVWEWELQNISDQVSMSHYYASVNQVISSLCTKCGICLLTSSPGANYYLQAFCRSLLPAPVNSHLSLWRQCGQPPRLYVDLGWHYQK